MIGPTFDNSLYRELVTDLSRIRVILVNDSNKEVISIRDLQDTQEYQVRLLSDEKTLPVCQGNRTQIYHSLLDLAIRTGCEPKDLSKLVLITTPVVGEAA